MKPAVATNIKLKNSTVQRMCFQVLRSDNNTKYFKGGNVKKSSLGETKNMERKN